MTVLRLLRFGITASTRSRRILIFVVFFIVLSGVTAFSINEIDRENRDLLLEQRSIVIEQKSDFLNNRANISSILNTFDNEKEQEIIIIEYFLLPNINLRIFSASVSLPWANTIVQPDEIRQGRFLHSEKATENDPETWEMIISNDFVEIDSFGENSLSNIFSVGNTLNFTDQTSKDMKYFEIIGVFEKPLKAPDNETWALISESAFKKLVSLLRIDQESEIYVYQVVVVSKGYSESIAAVFFGSAIGTTQDNVIKVNDLISINDPRWYIGSAPDTTNIKSQATNTDIILFLGVIGAPVVATLYAFIISRFRTREIAIMKAVGYSNSNVQIMLLTEIGTVSILGFLVAIFGLQILLTYNSLVTLDTTFIPRIWNPLNFSNPFPSFTAILTFIIVVLSNVAGFLIISRRSISVKPVELFKGAI